MSEPLLSVLVVAYHIADRELPRTLRSLRADYQHGVQAEDYEVIVLDNGSPQPIPPALVALHGGPTARVHRLDPALASPMRAVNVGAGLARGERLAVMIDGARLVSPGLVALALAAGDCDVLIAPTYHLGPDLQNRSVLAGYSKAAEDAALAALGWPDAPGSGERLWEIACFGGSQRFGLFEPPVESNFLCLSRARFTAMGGYDEAFDLPGGGYGSADALRRAVELPGARWLLAAGEGTFHQLHGGTAANDADPARFAAALARYEGQYQGLRAGRPLGPAAVPLEWVGAIPAAAVPFVQRSGQLSVARTLTEAQSAPGDGERLRTKNDELRAKVTGLKEKLEEQRARAERWKAKAGAVIPSAEPVGERCDVRLFGGMRRRLPRQQNPLDGKPIQHPVPAAFLQDHEPGMPPGRRVGASDPAGARNFAPTGARRIPRVRRGKTLTRHLF